MLPPEAQLCLFTKQEVLDVVAFYAVLVLILIIAWFGSASVGITSDRFGRRKAIAFGCIWGVIGAVLMAGAAHVAMRKCQRKPSRRVM